MLFHRVLLSSGAVAAVLCAAPGAVAQTRVFSVPSQPAVSGIPAFADQAQVQIIAPARGLDGVNTREVVGEMDVRAGLRRLLEGTPLQIASDTGQLITLHVARPGTEEMAASGVSGTIIDPATGEYLRNAMVEVVTVDGERRVVSSADGGAYRLGGLPTGAARLTVRYTGYPDRVVEVDLRSHEIERLDIQMVRQGGDGIILSDVVVTGVRDGDARAIMSQRQSMDIRNSLSAESYGDVSEGNPGEFIKFMPGVDTDSFEDGTVRTVSLRGLPPEYTSITLNGVSLAAANANTGAASSRTFSFEQMSLSAIDSIEISKTISADVDANAPAGTINVRTKRAFDRRGRRIMAQISGTTHSNLWDDTERTGPQEGGYGGRRFLPNGQFEYSDVFLDHRLGVVASVSQSRLYVEQEQIELGRNYVPTALSPDPMAITAINHALNEREISRFSSSLTLDFRATENLTLSLAGIYNEASIWAGATSVDFTTGARTRGVTGDALFDFTTQVPTTSNTLSISNLRTYKDGRSTNIIPSFEYDRGWMKLDGVLSYSNSISTYDPLGEKDIAYTLSAITSRGNFSAQRSSDLHRQNWTIRQTSGPDWSNPASFSVASPLVLRLNSSIYAEHTARTGALNATFNTNLLSRPFVLKTGLKAQRTEYDYKNPSDLDRYAYSGPLSITEILTRIQSRNQLSFADSGISITSVSGNPNIYLPSTTKLLDLYRENPSHWTPSAATSPTEWYNINIGNSRHYREDAQALYVMGTSNVTDRLTLRAGLRWERTETAALEADPLSTEQVRAAGYAVNASTGRATTIAGLQHQFLSRPKVWRTAEYDHFFPSASLKYAFSDSLDLQVGYSRTIRRPEVSVLSGVWRIDEDEQLIVAPNPGLEPELSDNLSVRLVKYFEPVGMVAVNYYRNRVKGLFQTQDLTAAEFGYSGEEYAGYLFRTTTSVGGDAIDIQGYEIEFSHAMDYLPGPFDGLSVRGSFMINDPEIPIVRSADRIGSLSLSYRKGPTRLFFNSVWTDEKYRSTTPTWFAPYWDTNLSGSYEIRPGWEAFFSARNLLDRSRNVIVPGSLATAGQIGDHSAIFIHGGRNATIGLRARF